MALRSEFVGAELPSIEVEVTPRMALAFAAGISDDRPGAGADESADFAASPFFCVSLEWRTVVEGRNRLFDLSPAEAIRAVHAGQDTRFLAPLRPGTRVKVGGQLIEVRPTRAGALAVTRLDVHEDGGRPISSTLSAALYRGVAVEGDARSLIAAAPPPPMLDEDPTASIREVSIPIDRWFAHRYTECAEIWNPIHTERRVALAAGLPDVIVHGTALWALAGRTIIADRAGGRIIRLAGTFSAMVEPGAPITVRWAPAGGHPGLVRFEVLNAAGQRAVSRGLAQFAEAD